MRKQELHGWAILLLGISGMAVSLLGGCWKNPVWFLGLLPGIFMLILAWSTRESIGYGDGLVILCMGCFYALGEMMAIVMIAITIAGIAALGLLIFGHKNRKSEFPFVPFHVGNTEIKGENMKWRGSYTVEAAVIIPVLIWTMAAAMCTGIDLLHEVRGEHEEKQMEDMWAVDSFYQYQILKEVKK